MNIASGLGQKDRGRLSSIFRKTKNAITVNDTADILGISPPYAAKMLARWAKKAWLSRVHRGIYVRVPFESSTSDIPLEDAWLIAHQLFSPCYIGGWSAAEYWDLTEQIFRTCVILTARRPRNRSPVIKGTSFMLRTISERAIFGTQAVWRGQEKIAVSDPSRTILDLMTDPRLGGGIRPTVKIFSNYLKSEKKNIDLLVEYAKRLGNGAVFKRLGFLLERYAPDQESSIRTCRDNLTKGTAKLDPSQNAKALITRWRLWVPARWMPEDEHY
jgi:predicted transcriptional regulator of viral defense system